MMSTVLRRAPLALLAGSLALGMVGCGSEHAGGSGAQPPKTEVTNSPTKSGSGDNQAANAPTVVLHRTGGVAGFMDTLTVKPDGQAILSSRGKQDYTCAVQASTLQTITSRASTVQDQGPQPRKAPKQGKGTPASPIPDQMHYTLELGDRTVHYSDVPEHDQVTRQLFRAMSDVLSSAASLRKGEQPDSGVVCG